MNYYFENEYLKNYIEEATNQICEKCFKYPDYEKLRIFREAFTEITILEILKTKGDITLEFFRGNNSISKNLEDALYAAEITNTISKENEKYEYSKITLESDDAEILRDEIKNQVLNSFKWQVQGIYNWLTEDKIRFNFDPNAFELVEIFIKYNNLKKIGAKIPEEITTCLNLIWENRKENFYKNNLEKSVIAISICEDSYNDSISSDIINSAGLRSLQKIAAIDLYINQEKRTNKNFRYTNADEYRTLTKNSKIAQKTGTNVNKYLVPLIESLNENNISNFNCLKLKR